MAIDSEAVPEMVPNTGAPDPDLAGVNEEPLAQKCDPEILLAINGLEERLLDAFERKLTYDAFKEKQIDRLHEDLQGYKSDLIGKALRPIISRIIKMHNDICRLMGGIDVTDPAGLPPDKVLRLFDSFREEVVDLLEEHGIHPFAGEVGAKFDPRRQSSAGTVESVDIGQLSTVAENVRPGFEQGTTILEKERVKVYVAAKASGVDLTVGGGKNAG